MKNFKLCSFFLIISVILISCGSVKVASDFDSEADFSQYKTFAFYKSGIDKVEISDIDKKRILKSIQNTLLNKGMIIDENPDILINIATKSSENIYIDNTFYSPYILVGIQITEGVIDESLIQLLKVLYTLI